MNSIEEILQSMNLRKEWTLVGYDPDGERARIDAEFDTPEEAWQATPHAETRGLTRAALAHRWVTDWATEKLEQEQ